MQEMSDRLLLADFCLSCSLAHSPLYVWFEPDSSRLLFHAKLLAGSIIPRGRIE